MVRWGSDSHHFCIESLSMFLDALLEMSSAQALSSPTNVPSTNSWDAGAPRNLGSGKPMYPTIEISAITGTTPAFTAVLTGYDDAAFTINATPVLTVTANAALLALIRARLAPGPGQLAGAGQLHCGVVPSHVPRRYWQWIYTMTGTTPTCTVTTGWVQDEQSNPAPSLT